jgi:hypothetical protein
MRRIALVCAVLCTCTTAAVAWGRSISVHPAASHNSRKTLVKPHHRGSHHKSHRTKHSGTTSSSSATSTKPAASSTAAAATTTATTSGVTLFGDGTVEPTTDNNDAGLAEAFPFSANLSGTAHTLYVYVDSHSTARTVIAGIYADNSGRPGTLLVRATLSSPQAGAWNTIPVSSTTVSSGTKYWIAVLGKNGTMYFRDRASGPCKSVNSAQTGLSSLPATWKNGVQWTTCPITAYVSGTGTPVSSADPPPTTTTTSTTPPTPVSPPALPLPPIALTSPHISGAAQEGQTLTTDNGTWLNGPTAYSYQWEDCDTSGANCSNISGATHSSYALTGNDVGNTMRVVVSASNSGGIILTPATSSQTGVVAAQPAPTNTAPPVISGTATQGQTLTASKGSWTGSPTSYGYQWRDCDTSGANCTDISGATASTYTPTANEVGDTVRVVATATNDGGSGSATSSQTGAVRTPAPAAPANPAAPSISGTATQGQTLSAAKGSWTGSPTSYAYQWRDCDTSGANCTNISGTTASTYTLTANEVGDTVRVVVTASNAGGSTPATSSQTAVVQSSTPAAPTNTTTPSMSGTATQGQTLSAAKGNWTGSPTSYAYQWRDCDTSGANCTNISGTTASTYTLTANEVGDTVRVVVTATNAGGSASATSAQTSTVASSGGTGGGTTNCFASPMACGYPDPAAPVGNAAHVGPTSSCSSMTQVNNDVTTSSSGQTIQNETIHGMLYINKPNVTVNNVCVITPDSESGPAIYIESGASNTLVENTSAGAVDRNAKDMEASVYNWSDNPASFDHDYFYNCGECIHDGVVSVSNSYVIANGMDNTSDHREAIYLSDDVALNHDTVLVPPENTPQVAVVFAANAPNPPAGTTLTVTNSLLAGGDDVFEAGQPQVSGDTIKNNNIARCTTGPMSGTGDGGTACGGYHGSSSSSDSYAFDSHGYWPNGGVGGIGCPGTSGPDAWTGNVWDDNGSAVSCN